MSTPIIKAIETRFKGHRFRSRLEARWAVVLDHMGVKWQYEPEGYNLGEAGCYLPDFWLPELNTYLEIKPEPPSENERIKMQTLLNHKQAFGAWGFDLKSNDSIWHWFPANNNLEQSEEYCWFTDTGPNPWPNNLPRLEKTHILYDIPKDDDEDMVCPICKGNYVHVDNPETLDDDYPHAIGLRGPVHVFNACSELCNHKWQLVVAFHKGNTTVAVTFKEDGLFTPLGHLTKATPWGGDTQLFIAAAEAGLSARFEHGESP